MTRCFANEFHAATNLELCQQRRNVEFDGTLREIEIRSDFLVGETIRNAGKNFLFAAREPHLAVNGLACLKQLVGFLNQIFQDFVFSLYQNGVITGSLPPDKAVHGEQPGCLIDRKTPIGAGLYMKMGNSRILFIKKEGIAVGYGTIG